ncbi:MAG: hypothetical protein N4A46_13385 [Schleiferiaceae bacterium]|jgi:hypothetical protein|nr:hypothetical protein [Schleiferiaceae bacterium]
MKNKVLHSAAILSIAVIGLTSCKGKKKAIDPPKGEVEIVLPCSEFKSDGDYFRAYSFGESSDPNVAKKKALSNAKGELAGQISTTMKVVGDNYVKSSEFNNKEELLERFEENTRTVINEKLNGIKPICDRLTQTTATGKYKYYIALELSGDQMVSDYYNSLTKNESIKIDYNYEKFKKTFEEEMRKMENQ